MHVCMQDKINLNGNSGLVVSPVSLSPITHTRLPPSVCALHPDPLPKYSCGSGILPYYRFNRHPSSVPRDFPIYFPQALTIISVLPYSMTERSGVHFPHLLLYCFQEKVHMGRRAKARHRRTPWKSFGAQCENKRMPHRGRSL
jgi:hypothetical protein